MEREESKLNQFEVIRNFRYGGSAFRFLGACAFAVFFFCANAVVAGEVIDIRTRDTTIKILLEGPSNPNAVIALFMGGDGAMEISDQGNIGKGRSNFAVTTRGLFQEKGFATAVVAAPADMGDLENISVPVLIVAHEKDSCGVPPPSWAARIADALKNAKPVRVKMFDAPDDVAKGGDPCGPTGHHGFPGIREVVIHSMIDFINNPK